MISRLKTWLDRSLELATAIVTGALVVDVTWQVFSRFILKNPSGWTEELATFLLIWAGLLGAALAYRRKAHLGIDYFVGKLSEKGRVWAEAIVCVIVAGFSASVLLWGGVELVAETLQMGQTAPATGLMLGHVYIAVPLAGFFLTIYSGEFLLASFRELQKLRIH